MPFAIRSSEENEIETLFIEGDLDIKTKDELEEKLSELVESGSTHIRLDLSKVDYLGSVAIAVMVQFSKRLQRKGGKLIIRAGSTETRRHFALLNLDVLLDLEEA